MKNMAFGIMLTMLLMDILMMPFSICFHVDVNSTFATISCQRYTEVFSFVNVTLSVRDYDGTPLKDAEVKAFSEDWGIKYPDWFGYTDANGNYKFEIPIGNWSFFAGGGWRYSQIRPGEGYFGTLLNVRVAENCTLTIQPEESVTVNVYDINGQRLDAEVRMMEQSHVPIVITPICGKTSNGRIIVHVTKGLFYDMLLYTFPSKSGYILHQQNITSGSTIDVKPSVQNTAQLNFEAYDRNFNPTGGLWVHINYHNFSVGEHTGLQPVSFSVDGKRQVYVSPSLVRIGYTFDAGGWHYNFIGEDYMLDSGSQLTFKFGGPLNVRIHVLRQNTQIWIDVRDSYGNIMNNFNDQKGETHVPIKLTRNGTIVFQGDIAEKVGGWNALMAGKLDLTYNIEDSPEYEIMLDLGFFGTFNLKGTLLSNSTLLNYETINTAHFTINAPAGFSEKFNKMAQLFELAYEAQSQAIQEKLSNKTSVTFYINYISAGFAGRNLIGMGIGFSLDSSLNTIPSTFIGVAFHELGHVFQLSPPLEDYYIAFFFGEPFATLLGNEAISKILGRRLELLDQGFHRDFFRYLQTKENINLVENVQFILFYLKKRFGMDIHRRFVHLWANKTLTDTKQKLIKAGFNTNETIIVLYSFLAQENLAWLFQLAGFEISKDRIDQGLVLILPLPNPAFELSSEIFWVNESVTFNASASYSPNGKITKYEWNFGDGNITTTEDTTINHVYIKEGRYTVILKVTDEKGKSNLTSKIIIITFRTDLNMDGVVNIVDLSIVAFAFQTKPKDPKWNALADLNKDEIINIIDLSLIAKDYGKTA